MIPGPEDERATPAFRLALALVAVAALLLRVPPALAEPVHGDEMASLAIASLPFGESLRRVVTEDIFNPPLYYLLLRVPVSLFGDSVLPLRLLSLLASVGVVLVAGSLSRRWLGSAAGLLAATLVAASDLQIRYAHEARSYALYALLVLVVLATLDRALERGGRKPWIPFVLASTALVYTHYVGWLYLVATFPAVFRRGRAGVRPWLVSVAVVTACLAPWAAAVVPHALERRGMVEWLGKAGWDVPPTTVATFNGIPPVPGGTRLTLLLGAPLAVAGGWWLLAGRAPRGGSPRRRGLLLAGACLLPLAVLFAIGRLRPIWHARYVVPSQALWCMLVSAGVVRLGARRAAWAAALGVAVVAVQLSHTAEHFRRRRNQPYDRVASYLRVRAGPEAVVLVTTDFVIGAPVRYHLRGHPPAPRPMPDRVEDVPDTVWVAFRPKSAAESRRVRELEERGWARGEGAFFFSDENPDNGTEVRLLRRTGGP
jgi:mannosyltransferase